MKRLLPAALGLVFLAIPLYPAFITLTGVQVPGISLVPVPLTLVLLGAAALIVAYAAVLLAITPGEPIPTAIAFAALPAAAVLAAALGFDPGAGAIFIAIAIFGVVLHAAIVRLSTRPHVEAAITVSFVTSGAIAAAVAIVLVLAQWPPDLYTVGHGRAIGTFILPGELAGYLIMYVPFAYAVARVSARRNLRIVAAVGAIVGAIALVLTFSRAGWIGMAAAVAFFVYTQRRRGRTRVAAVIVGAAVLAVGLVFNAHHDPSENFTRISIWRAASDMIARFPLSGVGPFDFATIYRWVRLPDGEPTAFHAHSFLLSVAVEMGLVGIAAVCLGWWRFVIALRERFRSASGSQTLALAIVAGLVGTWVQSLIDTVSVVVFAIWPLFTALALITVRAPSAAHDAAGTGADPIPRMPRAVIVGAGVMVLACAFVQLASDAVFARAGAPLSLPSRLDPALGASLYRSIERVTALPFVEATLAEAALRDGDINAASAHAYRLPEGPVRDELLARVAEARGDTAAAMELFLDAGDDQALQRYVDRLSARGRYRKAYDFEARVRDRFEAAPTRPNAAADSWWRLGRLAVRLHRPAEAKLDFARADAIAPLNTKYLIDAGTLALAQRDAPSATATFAKTRQIDPASADAVAGLGLAALLGGDVAQARRYSELANQLRPRAALVVRLRRALLQAGTQ
jgi:O-antigen ligase/tetratricopeptide (TPR) repeat protein